MNVIWFVAGWILGTMFAKEERKEDNFKAIEDYANYDRDEV